MNKYYFLIILISGVCFSLKSQTLENGISGTLTDLTPTGVTIKNEKPQKGDEGKKLVVLGDKLIFIGEDATNGEELWITDGTVSGTKLLKDIEVGSSSSSPTNIEKSGDRVFFSATTTDEGTELWVTDGTEAGTKIVSDLYPGKKGSTPEMITAFKNGVLFRAQDLVSSNYEQSWLYWSDGTTTKNIARRLQPRREGDSKYKFIQVTHNGEKAFFVGESETYGNEMWVTDGTEEGTKMILDIGFAEDPNSKVEGATVSSKIEWHFAVNESQVVFRAETPAWWGFLDDIYTSVGEELWVSDGTTEGTYFLGDFNKALKSDDVKQTKGSQYSHPFLYMGALYFRADDGEHHVELCRSKDLAPLSVENVLNINGEHNSKEAPTWVQEFCIWDSLFYFFVNSYAQSAAFPNIIGNEMAIYDGKLDTVYALADFFGPNDGLQHGSPPGKPSPLAVNRRLYFTGNVAEGTSDRAVYYIKEKGVDPTHTPVKMFNDAGDNNNYITVNFNENLAVISKDGSTAKLYVYDDGETKNPITANGVSGPGVYNKSGNRQTSGIQDNRAASVNIKIYPQPISDFLIAELPEPVCNAVLTNTKGQVVWNGQLFNGKEFSTAEFSAGTYIFFIKTKDGMATQKVSIVK